MSICWCASVQSKFMVNDNPRPLQVSVQRDTADYLLPSIWFHNFWDCLHFCIPQTISRVCKWVEIGRVTFILCFYCLGISSFEYQPPSAATQSWLMSLVTRLSSTDTLGCKSFQTSWDRLQIKCATSSSQSLFTVSFLTKCFPFCPFGESSGKQQVRLECWKQERTANVASWIKRWFWWFTIWMSGRLGKVVSSKHKEMLHSPKAQHIYMSKYLLPRTQRVVFKCVHMKI